MERDLQSEAFKVGRDLYRDMLTSVNEDLGELFFDNDETQPAEKMPLIVAALIHAGVEGFKAQVLLDCTHQIAVEIDALRVVLRDYDHPEVSTQAIADAVETLAGSMYSLKEKAA